jgi:hypothetical protein
MLEKVTFALMVFNFLVFVVMSALPPTPERTHRMMAAGIMAVFMLILVAKGGS